MSFDEIARRRFTAAGIWLALAAGTVYLLIFEPGRSGFFPPCPFRTITGFTCPGCGSTRGMHLLLHGDVLGAFQFNPLLLLSLPFLIFALVRYTHAAVNGGPLKTNSLNAKYIWVIFVVIVGFWIFRNTSLYPFPI